MCCRFPNWPPAEQMMRQGANSAVRFSSYSTLKQFVQGNSRPGQQLPSVVTFGIGAAAGIITVCEFSVSRVARCCEGGGGWRLGA